ncbi:MAG TPA: hypothetical protein VLF79_02210 [Candidatus Saccharimonadales bacterium]|nr:hypothetical protein [Candidatus Saccharimonadales bacterium]
MKRLNSDETISVSGGVGAVVTLVGFQELSNYTHNTGVYNTDQANISHLQHQNSAIRLLESEGVIQVGNRQLEKNKVKIEAIRSHEPHQAGPVTYASGEIGSIVLGAVVFGVAGYVASKRLRRHTRHSDELVDVRS